MFNAAADDKIVIEFSNEDEPNPTNQC